MKVEPYGGVVIPELEAARGSQRNRLWSAEEEAVLRSYYGDVSNRALLDYLAEHYPPGRSLASLHNKASHMGLTT